MSGRIFGSAFSAWAALAGATLLALADEVIE
jgi:hypothetical protein